MCACKFTAIPWIYSRTRSFALAFVGQRARAFHRFAYGRLQGWLCMQFDLSHKTCARLHCSCLFHVQRVPSAFSRRLSFAYSTFGLLHARFRPGRVPGERVPSSHVIVVVPLTPGPTIEPCTQCVLLSCLPWPSYCPSRWGIDIVS